MSLFYLKQRKGDGMETLEKMEQHPLYDTALEEVVEVIPPGIPEDAPILLSHVRTLMIAAWLRGVGWSVEHPDTQG